MKQFEINNNPLLIEIRTPNIITINSFFLKSFLWLNLFSFLVLLINHYYLHYHGINYINQNFIFEVSAYSLLYMAICKLIPQLNHYTTKFLDIFYFTMMVLLIEIFTSAIQLTPFQRIDHLVYQLEPLPLDQLIAWTNKHPLIKEHLQNIYATLIPGMLTLPFFAVFLLKRTMIHRWIKLNIIYVCLGFSFYYFFPTCGPVSVIPFPEIFDQGQLNNILKFNQIHQWKMPTTEDGGLIAFPSFHVIWAWAITLFFKWIHPWLFRIALVWFVLICISCVCLGWHYSVDIIGSILLIGIAHFFISKTETTKAS